MLTREENDLLNRVGQGTPCGELMRRYWHPICPEGKLLENPVQPVRILWEDLVLFRDRQGHLTDSGPCQEDGSALAGRAEGRHMTSARCRHGPSGGTPQA